MTIVARVSFRENIEAIYFTAICRKNLVTDQIKAENGQTFRAVFS